MLALGARLRVPLSCGREGLSQSLRLSSIAPSLERRQDRCDARWCLSQLLALILSTGANKKGRLPDCPLSMDETVIVATSFHDGSR